MEMQAQDQQQGQYLVQIFKGNQRKVCFSAEEAKVFILNLMTSVMNELEAANVVYEDLENELISFDENASKCVEIRCNSERSMNWWRNYINDQQQHNNDQFRAWIEGENETFFVRASMYSVSLTGQRVAALLKKLNPNFEGEMNFVRSEKHQNGAKMKLIFEVDRKCNDFLAANSKLRFISGTVKFYDMQ